MSECSYSGGLRLVIGDSVVLYFHWGVVVGVFHSGWGQRPDVRVFLVRFAAAFREAPWLLTCLLDRWMGANAQELHRYDAARVWCEVRALIGEAGSLPEGEAESKCAIFRTRSRTSRAIGEKPIRYDPIF